MPFPFISWLPVTMTLVSLLAISVHMPPIAIGQFAVTLSVNFLWRRRRFLEQLAGNPLRDILTFDTSRP